MRTTSFFTARTLLSRAKSMAHDRAAPRAALDSCPRSWEHRIVRFLLAELLLT
jgi:hypothetical protein